LHFGRKPKAIGGTSLGHKNDDRRLSTAETPTGNQKEVIDINLFFSPAAWDRANRTNIQTKMPRVFASSYRSGNLSDTRADVVRRF